MIRYHCGSAGRYTAYFGDFGANVYALDAETGKQLWTTCVEAHHAAAVSGSVLLDPAYIAALGYFTGVALCCTACNFSALDIQKANRRASINRPMDRSGMLLY